jgi:hypothetical protein
MCGVLHWPLQHGGQGETLTQRYLTRQSADTLLEALLRHTGYCGAGGWSASRNICKSASKVVI